MTLKKFQTLVISTRKAMSKGMSLSEYVLACRDLLLAAEEVIQEVWRT